MILGCFMGAGFVSGREIASYFSQYGEFSNIAIVIAVVLLFVLILFFLVLSDKIKDFKEFAKIYFGRFYTLANWMLAFCLLILISAMFAGTISLAESMNVNKFAMLSITFVLCFFIVIGKVRILSKVNMLFMPILITLLLIVSTKSGSGYVYDGCVAGAIISGGAYVFINIVTLGLFIIEIGERFSFKAKVVIAVITSGIIGVMLFVLNKAIMMCGVVGEAMPNLALARNDGVLYFCLQVGVYCGLFTTLSSNVYLLGNFFNKYINNYYLSLMLALALGIFISVIGFVWIIGYVYWLIGVVGIIMIAKVVLKEKKDRKFLSS